MGGALNSIIQGVKKGANEKEVSKLLAEKKEKEEQFKLTEIKLKRFEDENKVFAKEIIEILEKGLKKLKSRPEYFKRFDSPNGWGTYKYFVPFVEKYLKACKEYPEAIVRVDR